MLAFCLEEGCPILTPEVISERASLESIDPFDTIVTSLILPLSVLPSAGVVEQPDKVNTAINETAKIVFFMVITSFLHDYTKSDPIGQSVQNINN